MGALVVGVTFDGTVRPMATTIAVSALLASAAFVLLVRPARAAASHDAALSAVPRSRRRRSRARAAPRRCARRARAAAVDVARRRRQLRHDAGHAQRGPVGERDLADHRARRVVRVGDDVARSCRSSTRAPRRAPSPRAPRPACGSTSTPRSAPSSHAWRAARPSLCASDGSSARSARPIARPGGGRSSRRCRRSARSCRRCTGTRTSARCRAGSSRCARARRRSGRTPAASTPSPRTPTRTARRRPPGRGRSCARCSIAIIAPITPYSAESVSPIEMPVRDGGRSGVPVTWRRPPIASPITPKPGPVAVRTGLAVARHAHHHEPGIVRGQRVVAEAPASSVPGRKFSTTMSARTAPARERSPGRPACAGRP